MATPKRTRGGGYGDDYGGGGGFPGGFRGGFSGVLTPLGRAILIFYASSFVLGLLLTNWAPAPFNALYMLGLLSPMPSVSFGVWQFVTHLLVYYPSVQMMMGFILQLLVFYLFAWQIEAQAGRGRFLLILFGVPFVTGIVGLPFTTISVFQGTFAGFSVAIDCLIVAFYMMNRESQGNFMFIIPLKMIHLIYFTIGMNVLTFIGRANPNLMYQLIAMGLTYLLFRYNIQWDPELWRLKRKHNQLMKQYQRFDVIPGGKESDKTIYH